jgi:hypothetical protein
MQSPIRREQEIVSLLSVLKGESEAAVVHLGTKDDRG